MYFTLNCGCVCDGCVYVTFDCECCGRDYEIEDAHIITPCDTHK